MVLTRYYRFNTGIAVALVSSTDRVSVGSYKMGLMIFEDALNLVLVSIVPVILVVEVLRDMGVI